LLLKEMDLIFPFGVGARGVGGVASTPNTLF